MNIVLTNDDGYDAPGLWAAFEALRGMGTVHIVAPRTERSASSHAITLRRPITVKRMPRAESDRVFAVDGSPADCVRLAVAELVEGPVGLVLSGINRGANAGVDTYYSGTVAAAREGALLGLQAVAVSQAIRTDVDVDWTLAGEVAAKIIRGLIKEDLPGPGFWNVNFPAPIPADHADRIHRVPVAADPMPLTFDRETGDDGLVTGYSYAVPYWQREVANISDYSTIRDGGLSISAIPLFCRF